MSNYYKVSNAAKKFPSYYSDRNITGAFESIINADRKEGMNNTYRNQGSSIEYWSDHGLFFVLVDQVNGEQNLYLLIPGGSYNQYVSGGNESVEHYTDAKVKGITVFGLTYLNVKAPQRDDKSWDSSTVSTSFDAFSYNFSLHKFSRKPSQVYLMLSKECSSMDKFISFMKENKICKFDEKLLSIADAAASNDIVKDTHISSLVWALGLIASGVLTFAIFMWYGFCAPHKETLYGYTFTVEAKPSTDQISLIQTSFVIAFILVAIFIILLVSKKRQYHISYPSNYEEYIKQCKQSDDAN